MRAVHFQSWILALRPKTLSAAVVPIVVSSALSFHHSENWSWNLSLFALLSVGFIQIATNLFNDAIDFEKGADTEKRIGPIRVTQTGLLSRVQVYRGAIFCLFLALLFGVPLVVTGGWPIVAIGLVSLFLAYGYTGGPYPLAYKGLGDLFVLIFFGWVAVGGLYFIQTLQWTWSAFVAGTQVGLLGTVLIAINNFRDYQTDREVNKKTLVVRFGPMFARWEILMLYVVALGLGGYWLSQGQVWAASLPLLSAPLMLRVVKGVWSHSPGLIYNQYLAQSAGVQVLFGLLLAIGLLF